MNKTILINKNVNGTFFDTEKAEILSSKYYSNMSNQDYEYEELYRTKDEKYFVAREIGLMDGFENKQCLEIEPLGREWAKQWMTMNGQYDSFVRMFGDMGFEAECRDRARYGQDYKSKRKPLL